MQIKVKMGFGHNTATENKNKTPRIHPDTELNANQVWKVLA